MTDHVEPTEQQVGSEASQTELQEQAQQPPSSITKVVFVQSPPGAPSQAASNETVASEPQDLQQLRESFKRIYKGPDLLRHEYELEQEAARLGIALSKYRRLYRLGAKEPLPVLAKAWRSTGGRIWKWSGLGEKQGWDYLQLLISASVPFVLFFAGEYFTNKANAQQEAIAADRYRQEALSQYFDQMTQLLIDKNLRHQTDPRNEVREMARARTLSTLQELDGNRKGLVLKFLNEESLISLNQKGSKQKDPIVNLEGSNLKEVSLTHGDLSSTCLVDTIMKNADLSYALLEHADLRKAFLKQANLSHADLKDADLRDSTLKRSDLSHADLSGAKLKGATYDNLTKFPEHFDPEKAGLRKQ